MKITVSDKAASQIAQILKENTEADYLRLRVIGGGCSGFSYQFDLETERKEKDVFIKHGSAKVLIDSTSAGFLEGSEIDWLDELVGARFEVKNPNASSSCGCGTSFSI